jgi:hypothetical protein
MNPTNIALTENTVLDLIWRHEITPSIPPPLITPLVLIIITLAIVIAATIFFKIRKEKPQTNTAKGSAEK